MKGNTAIIKPNIQSARKQVKRRRIPFFFQGERGKRNKKIILGVAVVIAVIVLVLALRPEQTLFDTPEIARIQSSGTLVVAVRNDMGGFCMDGTGLEAELATILANRILPELEGDSPVKLVEVSSKGAATVLTGGDVDAAIALMVEGGNSAFLYTQPYYTDDVVFATVGSHELDVTDMLVGGIINSTSYSKAERLKQDEKGNTLMNMKGYSSYPDMLAALVRGDIATCVMPGAYFDRYCEQYGLTEYKTLEDELPYSIAFNSEDEAVRAIADIMLSELIQDGELARMIQKYGLKR